MSDEPPVPEPEQLRAQVERQIERMERADKERPTLLAQSAYIRSEEHTSELQSR